MKYNYYDIIELIKDCNNEIEYWSKVKNEEGETEGCRNYAELKIEVSQHVIKYLKKLLLENV